MDARNLKLIEYIILREVKSYGSLHRRKFPPCVTDAEVKSMLRKGLLKISLAYNDVYYVPENHEHLIEESRFRLGLHRI